MKPFAARSRSQIAAILLVFAVFSLVSVGLSIHSTTGSRHQAAVVEVAARQRALAERYVNGVLLLRSGQHADPYYTARILARSAQALLDGGTAPAVNGDDDQTTIHSPRLTAGSCGLNSRRSSGWFATWLRPGARCSPTARSRRSR
jgi:hypothetical protein